MKNKVMAVWVTTAAVAGLATGVCMRRQAPDAALAALGLSLAGGFCVQATLRVSELESASQEAEAELDRLRADVLEARAERDSLQAAFLRACADAREAEAQLGACRADSSQDRVLLDRWRERHSQVCSVMIQTNEDLWALGMNRQRLHEEAQRARARRANWSPDPTE